MSPRDGSGVYSSPPGTHGTPNTTILSANYNSNVDDVAADLNTPRPIVAGGTGATTAAGALTALGAASLVSPVFTGDPQAPTPAAGDNDTSIATTAFVTAVAALKVDKAGDTMTGALTVAPINLVSTANVITSDGTNTFFRADGFHSWQNSAGSQTNMLIQPTGNFQVLLKGFQPGGGAWADSSDARIKTVAGAYSHGLAEICQIKPVRYQFKGNDSLTADTPSMHAQAAQNGVEHIGVVAQEIEPVLPETVIQIAGFIDGEPVDDLRIYDSSALTYALVNAVKELADRVAVLEGRA